MAQCQILPSACKVLGSNSDRVRQWTLKLILVAFLILSMTDLAQGKAATTSDLSCTISTQVCFRVALEQFSYLYFFCIQIYSVLVINTIFNRQHNWIHIVRKVCKVWSVMNMLLRIKTGVYRHTVSEFYLGGVCLFLCLILSEFYWLNTNVNHVNV